jgi:polyhydroxyalkanoate synthesis regulator phasin
MAIRIPIISDFSDAGVKAAGKSFGGLQDKVKGLGGSLPAIGVAMAGIGAASAFIYKAVKAAAEDQKSQALLERQLKQTLHANDALVASMERFVSKAQLATGVTDTELRAGLATLVRATGDATQAQDLLNLSMDISAATGKDLDAVNIALAKAAGGNMTALQKLGVPLDKTALKTKDLTALTKALEKQFGGAAATAANTFQGKLKILQGQFGEIVETIGAAMLPYLDKFATFLVEKVAPAIERITSVIGQKGLIAGFQQLIFESGKAGPAIVNTVKNVTIAVAHFVNILYKAVKLQQAQIYFIKGDFGAAFDAIRDAFTGSAIDVDALAKTFDGLAFGFDHASASGKTLIDIYDKVGNKVLPVVIDAVGDTEKEVAKAAKSVDTMAQKIEEARKELETKFKNALEGATKKLEEARKAYDDFKTTVSESITSEFSISGAADAAKEAGTTILAQLNQQALGAKAFGSKVEQLLGMGLSESALRKVLEAGQEAGTAIANELISGGSEAITGPTGINQLVNDLNMVADLVGTLAADRFYLAGVTQGEALVRGVMEKIAYARKLLENAKTLADYKAIGAFFDDSTTGVPPLTMDAPALTAEEREGIRAGRGGSQYNITISGGMATSAEIGRIVIDNIKAANRAYGPAAIEVL